MLLGQNVALVGAGGVGKTYCVKEYVRRCQCMGRKVIITAPTGCAAANVNGLTNHSAFHMPLHVIKEKPSRISDVLLNADVVIIDEISMVRRDQFSFIAESIHMAEKESKSKKQLVVVGDFYQLSPVVLGKDIREFVAQYTAKELLYAFNSDEWESFNFIYPELTLPMRQTDEKFLNALNAIRCVDNNKLEAAIEYINSQSSRNWLEDAIFLCGLNETASKVNQDEIMRLPGSIKIYECKGDCNKITSEIKSRLEERLCLKIGAKIMVTVNNRNEGYYNGNIGHIKELGEDVVKIIFSDGKEVVMGRMDFQFSAMDKNGEIVNYHIYQFPIRLAYAVTIHKSQGMTFERVNLDPYVWAAGQLYVALSRVKNIKGLYLSRKIESKYIVENGIVKTFYNRINIAAA